MWVAYDAETMDVLADGTEYDVKQFAGKDITIIAATEAGWRRALKAQDPATMMSGNPPRGRGGKAVAHLPEARREWLGVAEVAVLAGVKPQTWTAYVNRGQAPPAERRNPDTGRREWSAEVIGEWLASRPGAGARTDLRSEAG